MAGKVVEKITEKINPIIEDLGYEVVEVEYAKKNDGMNLTFYINSKEGITLDDCEKVHKAIDGPLDELNPTEDVSYILSVSSCGLDRPIKTDKDLERSLRKEIDIKLYAPINNKKEYTGTLIGYNTDNVEISSNGETLLLPRKKIGSMTLHIEL